MKNCQKILKNTLRKNKKILDDKYRKNKGNKKKTFSQKKKICFKMKEVIVIFYKKKKRSPNSIKEDLKNLKNVFLIPKQSNNNLFDIKKIILITNNK